MEAAPSTKRLPTRRLALVVIDLQKGIVAVPAVHPIDEIVQRAPSLATAFRRHGLPVVLDNATGRAPGRTEAVRPSSIPPSNWADLADELDAQPDDYRVTKQRWGAIVYDEFYVYQSEEE